MAGSRSSLMYSFLLFTVILTQMMYRGKLASSELFTILGGFISSLLFLVLLTFIGNFHEANGIGLVGVSAIEPGDPTEEDIKTLFSSLEYTNLVQRNWVLRCRVLMVKGALHRHALMVGVRCCGKPLWVTLASPMFPWCTVIVGR
ncbi:hypothetical protein V6N13_053646 [Hibiscus sabdariffa]